METIKIVDSTHDKDDRNNDKYVKDMTEGEPLKLLFSFAIPLFLGNIFQQAYNLTDSIVVGRYVGKEALGAVGCTSGIMVFINSITIGLSIGIGIVIAQFFGAKNKKNVMNSIGNSFYIVFISSLIMAIIGFSLSKTILIFLKTPNDTLYYAKLYLQTNSIGFIPIAFFHLLSSILRALGDSKTPLIFLIISCIINIILDIIFVTKFNLGVFGVGIATSISQLISACFCIIYAINSNSYFRISKEDFIFNKNIFLNIIKFGIPVAGQSSLIALSLIALQRVVNSFGSDLVTAFTIVSRIELIIQQPFSSLGAALATYTGQNIGAGKYERVRLGYIKVNKINTTLAIFVFIIFNVFTNKIVEIFGKDPKVIEYSITGIRITSSFYIFLGLIHSSRNILNGAGDTKFGLVNGIVECIGRVCFAKPLTMIPLIGKNGVWLTTGITWLLNGIFCVLRYLQGNWKNMNVLKTEKVQII